MSPTWTLEVGELSSKIVSKGEGCIATVHGRSEKCIANARLIAAAPDMLEAIKAFLPSKISSGNRSVPDDIVIPLDVTIGELRRLEAAIAKATHS